jgi:hypothetical protein
VLQVRSGFSCAKRYGDLLITIQEVVQHPKNELEYANKKEYFKKQIA